ncbi:hypothetical protein yc1106_02578 [Curvularia clavata]|uniref:Haloacid dehalogenase-like hydrolase n=1 Tax=Curvularia clavata TaxID=95742 RepID=A0A9Q8Z5L6_CURCL|nr:hypothetical protein yc1106_02578 [Curvularia clavata]
MPLYGAGRRASSSVALPRNLYSFCRLLSSSQATAMSSRLLINKGQPMPMHWVLDWDGSITKKDTLDALVKISAAEHPTSPIADHWQCVSQAYMADYTATLNQLVPDGALPTTIDEEKHLLSKLRDVEQRSLDRVYSSGIFTGLTKQGIDIGAKQAIQTGQVQLRNGFSSLFEHIESQKSNTFAILSVNWSRHFIHSCLEASGIIVASNAIVSNELDGIPAGEPSSGRIIPAFAGDKHPLISSGDKLLKFGQMQQEDTAKVYIGDSWTDIECLLAADLGVCVRDDPMSSSQKTLAKALDRLRVSCLRLKDWRQDSNPAVVWVKDFTELLQWVETRS